MSTKPEGALFPVPSSTPKENLPFFQALRRNLAMLLGHEGNTEDRALRVKDLVIKPGHIEITISGTTYKIPTI